MQVKYILLIKTPKNNMLFVLRYTVGEEDIYSAEFKSRPEFLFFVIFEEKMLVRHFESDHNFKSAIR